MRLYVDASALVKRYLAEAGSDAVREAMEAARIVTACRVGFAETLRALGRAGRPGAVGRFERDWLSFDVVEVDRALTRDAARLALIHGLGSLDALHLAAALSLPAEELAFATWDRRLHRAASVEGLRTLPASLG